MSLRTRRIIYLSFIGVFVVAGPLLVLYARGYRYSADRSTLALTGTLVVSTIPKGANIELNGVPVKYTTPTTLTAIPPNPYHIKLTKSGYKPWTKNITLPTGGALFISNIQLWRDALPISLADGDYQQFAPNPDGTGGVLTSWRGNQESFWYFSNETDTLTKVAERPIAAKPTDQLTWSPRSNRVLVRTGAGLSLLDLTTSEPVLSDLPTPFPTTGLWHWSQNNPTLIYGTDGRSIVSFNAARGSSSIPTSLVAAKPGETITDFWTTGNSLYVLLQRTQRVSTLTTYPLTGAQTLSSFDLPTALSYRYLEARSNLVALVDSDQQMTLWSLTGTTSALKLLAVPDVATTTFLPASNELLYTTLAELWTFNPTTSTKTLVTRLGTQVDAPAWYPTGSHLLFTTEHKLWVIERDERDVHNRWELANFTDLTGYTINPAGTKLYFAGTIGSRPGFWRLDLQ